MGTVLAEIDLRSGAEEVGLSSTMLVTAGVDGITFQREEWASDHEAVRLPQSGTLSWHQLGVPEDRSVITVRLASMTGTDLATEPIWTAVGGVSRYHTYAGLEFTAGGSIELAGTQVAGAVVAGAETPFAIGDGIPEDVPAGSRSPWATFRVRLDHEIIASLAGGSGTYRRRVETLVIEIAYTDFPIGGIGGDGGDGGGGGDTGDGGGGDDLVAIDCRNKRRLEGELVTAQQPYALAWTNEDLYYLSVGGRTLVMDGATSEWTDAGYGRVHAVALADAPNLAGTMLLARRTTASSGGVSLHHRTITYEHPEAYHPALRGIDGGSLIVTFGPFSGEGEAVRARLKRVLAFRLYGTWTDPSAETTPRQVGLLRAVSDTGRVEVYPIETHVMADSLQKVGPQEALFEQRFTNALVGRSVYFTILFTYKCLSISEAQVEYSVLK